MKEELATVARFQQSAEALIVKGRLEAEGILVYLSDHHTIDTDPLVSNAIGGVKLKVSYGDKQAALQVLESIAKYSLDDEGREMICPNCRSSAVLLLTHVRGLRSLLPFLFSFLINALPIGIKYSYHCDKCSHKFNVT